MIVKGSGIGIHFACARFLYCSKISGTEFKINKVSYLLMCSSDDKSVVSLYNYHVCFFLIENVAYSNPLLNRIILLF